MEWKGCGIARQDKSLRAGLGLGLEGVAVARKRAPMRRGARVSESY